MSSWTCPHRTVEEKKEFVFQGVDLEVILLHPFSIYPSSSSLNLCVLAETLAQILTRCHAGTHSLSHTHILSPSSKSNLVCFDKSQGSKRLCPIHARTRASLHQPQAQLIRRSMHRHAYQSARPPTDPSKVIQGKQETVFANISFFEKKVFFWNS